MAQAPGRQAARSGAALAEWHIRVSSLDGRCFVLQRKTQFAISIQWPAGSGLSMRHPQSSGVRCDTKAHALKPHRGRQHIAVEDEQLVQKTAMASASPLLDRPAAIRGRLLLALANVGAAAVLAWWIGGTDWAAVAAGIALAVFLLPAVWAWRKSPLFAAPKQRCWRHGPRFDRIDGPTLFCVNILLLVVVGILAIGVEFAFVAALAAALLWLAGVVLLVVRGSGSEGL